AFTGPVWRRSDDLYAIAEFVARGGASGRLLNVTPRVVARYARLLGETSAPGMRPQPELSSRSEVATCM
ncbi:MAG: hypothetical protein ACRDHP_16040, partial [Ktedonobacterales bacterium]